jgi:hypothetical protein
MECDFVTALHEVGIFEPPVWQLHVPFQKPFGRRLDICAVFLAFGIGT